MDSLRNIKSIAIDDEPMALEIVVDYINKVPFLRLEESFRKPLQALDFLQKNEIDLIYLDINMPDLTGLQFLKTLNKRPLIILTTAYSEYALESYDLDVVDYLLKPIEFDRFLKASNKALATFKSQINTPNPVTETTSHIEKDFIFVKSGTQIHKLKLEDILFVEGTGNYITFHINNKKILSLIKMSELVDILPKQKFVRVHKSYIISIIHIDLIESYQVVVSNHKIPIGKTYKEQFLNFIQNI